MLPENTRVAKTLSEQEKKNEYWIFWRNILRIHLHTVILILWSRDNYSKGNGSAFSQQTAEPLQENVYILMDDMGFAHLGCYDSNIHTPCLDKLADEGVRVNNFHTTAVCSATRASLLTGANHHAAGISGLVEM